LRQQASGKHRKLAELSAFPIQTFYVPFKDDDVFQNMFFQINSGKAKAPLESIISVAFSTSDTIVWYDHWEDGFDIDTTNATATAKTTEIWGDGNAANGCAPKVTPCTDATDRIKAGQSIVVQNTVAIPRVKTQIRYDGGDRLQTSFPVTVTRGAYPTEPGSLMAGAVDVVDLDSWGTQFEAPTGQDIGTSANVFEFCGLFFMAANDGTVVTLPNKKNITLNQGESSSVRVNQGDTISSTAIVQVHLITGDILSFYEMRWYSLLPSPTCKSAIETRCPKPFIQNHFS
jgi:hypothetical protein